MIDDAEIEGLLRAVGERQLEGYCRAGGPAAAVKEDHGHGPSVVTRWDVES